MKSESPASMDEAEVTDILPLGIRQTAKMRRRQRIELAAARLLLEKTFDEITTKEVAAAAGIGEATLFRYIRSKQELLTLVYGDQLDDALNRIDEADAVQRMAAGTSMESDVVFSRIMNIYRARCDFYLQNPTNAARYLREGFSLESPDIARHLAQGDRTIRLVAGILREGQRAGSIRSDIDADLVAQNCHGTYMHEIDRTAVRGFPPDSIWARISDRLAVQLVPLAVADQTTRQLP